MRRRHHILPVAFAASLLGGCLGSFNPPGDPAPAPTDTTAAGTNGNGAQTGSGDQNMPPGDNGATGGTSSGPMMPPATQGSITLSLDKDSDSIRLNETKSYTATITPTDGFVGGLTLALDNPPAGVTAKFDPAQLNITDANPVTAKVTLTVASDATAADSVPLAIKAASGDITASANLGLAIPAELLIVIQPGVDIGTAANPNKEAFGPYGMPVYQVASGTKVTWINMDSINHEIHSDGSLGINHENGPLMANGANSYTQTIKGNPGDVFTYRCHIHDFMKGQFILK